MDTLIGVLMCVETWLWLQLSFPVNKEFVTELGTERCKQGAIFVGNDYRVHIAFPCLPLPASPLPPGTITWHSGGDVGLVSGAVPSMEPHRPSSHHKRHMPYPRFITWLSLQNLPKYNRINSITKKTYKHAQTCCTCF